MVTTRAPEDAYTAEPFVPDRGGLTALRKAAADRRGCPLHRDTAQTVFGTVHFKFTQAEPRKRRIHKAPTLRETTA